MTKNIRPDGWTKNNLLDISNVNPKEKLSKGTEAPYVAMERLQPFTRQISGFEMRAFKGGTKFRNGDTLVARITPCLENGKTSFVDIFSDDVVGYGSTEFIILREKKNKSINKFLYYFAVSPRFREVAIKSMTGTSGRQRVQTDVIANKVFYFPPLPEQKAIVGVLSSLDDKIELLRKQNKTLEAIAQTIFKEWFVNFNFPDKNGKPYKENGGKMTDSDLGKIPADWRVGELSEVVQVFDSKRIPLSKGQREKRKGQYPYHGATTIMDYVDDYLFDGVYLLLAEDGSVITKNGYPFLQYVWGKMWVNNHAHVLQGDNDFSTEMLYLYFRRKKIAEVVTGAVQLKINQTNLLGIDIVIPKAERLQQFNRTIKDIFNKIRNNHKQIKTLVKLRDTLLPKMMSGQIRVKI